MNRPIAFSPLEETAVVAASSRRLIIGLWFTEPYNHQLVAVLLPVTSVAYLRSSGMRSGPFGSAVSQVAPVTFP